MFSIVCPYNKINLKYLKSVNPYGIILSGGPNSLLDKKSPKINKFIFNLNIPVLGICYGLQLICHLNGGKLKRSKTREYGHAKISIIKNSKLFIGYKNYPRAIHLRRVGY